MRRKRLLLLAIVALGLAPGTFVRTPAPPPDYASGLQVLDLEPDQASVGPFTLEGVWHLSSENDHFGGYSALLARPDGSLLAGSDAGRLLSLPRPDGGTGETEFAAFPGASQRDKRDVDLEALTQDEATGTIWAAYEVSNAIERHADLSEPGARIVPEAMADWAFNSGSEAMVRLPDGRFIVLSEQKTRFGGDSHEGLLFDSDPVEGGEPIIFQLATPDEMRPVDMTGAPGGKVLILLRNFDLFPPRFEVSLAIADPAEIEAGENWPMEVLAELGSPIPPENYEGIALTERDDACTLWIISDDNFSRFQRTLLLKLGWPTCKRARE